MTTYTLHQARHNHQPEGANGQIPHTHSVHDDHLMESVFEYTWFKDGRTNRYRVVGYICFL